jgi:integrase
VLPTAPIEEDNMQGKRTRAIDSRGRPVAGLYTRDGRFIAGFNCPQTGKWRMVTLGAETLTEARRERDGIIAALREGRTCAPSQTTFGDLFADWQDARRLSDRTRRHERELRDRHLAALADRRAQEVTAADLARVLRVMRDRYSPWTCVAVHRIARGTFAHGVRRGFLTRSPADGLAPSEIPKAKNAREVAVLDSEALARLVAAASSERWRAALGLAAFAGFRLGEIRALRWGDVNLDAGTLAVARSLLRDGTVGPTKTAAGRRVVPLLPALRCPRRLAPAFPAHSPR